jgi:hypothetical protein
MAKIYTVVVKCPLGSHFYIKLVEHLENNTDSVHVFDNMWFVSTDKNVKELYDELYKFLDTYHYEKIFISRLDIEDCQGYINSTFWNWLIEHHKENQSMTGWSRHWCDRGPAACWNGNV